MRLISLEVTKLRSTYFYSIQHISVIHKPGLNFSCFFFVPPFSYPCAFPCSSFNFANQCLIPCWTNCDLIDVVFLPSASCFACFFPGRLTCHHPPSSPCPVITAIYICSLSHSFSVSAVQLPPFPAKKRKSEKVRSIFLWFLCVGNIKRRCCGCIKMCVDASCGFQELKGRSQNRT